MSHWLVVANPVSGKMNAGKLEDLDNRLSRSGISYKLITTENECGATPCVIKHFTKDFTNLIIVGGDGTLNQSINGLPNFDRPIGFLPMGTGNDFIKYFEFESKLDQHLNRLYNTPICEVSVGLCNGNYFLNGVGAGFDGQIVYNMKNRSRWFSGHTAYLAEVIRILGTYKEKAVRIKIDGQFVEKDILLVVAGLGTTYGGGFKLLPEARLYHDYLDICLIGRVPALKRFLSIKKLQNGTHANIPGVEFYQGREIIIEGNHLKGQMDGELLENPPFRISMASQKLKVMGVLKA
ncbi:MAG: YegS/Rv2252/BmrU family lipid kinase [Cyclobacteriaceae bacterium]|nr:YegS/Rv2252/BmrU family lipid kinase [Cyclobacteriaceae bacterium]